MRNHRIQIGFVLAGSWVMFGCTPTAPAAAPTPPLHRTTTNDSMPDTASTTPQFPTPWPTSTTPAIANVLSGLITAPATLIGNNGGSYRVLDTVSQQPVAKVTVGLFDASGTALPGSNGRPLTTTTDADGHYAFSGTLPSENFVAKVKLSSGDLQAIVPDAASATRQVNVDLVSSLATGYLLNRCSGQQTALDKLSATAIANLQAQTGAAIAGGDAPLPPSLSLTDILSTMNALKAKDSALDAQLNDIDSQLAASGTASPTTPPAGLRTTTVSGAVYDEHGVKVDGAAVLFKSLNATAPFDTTVDTNTGNYLINGVPAGVEIQCSVSKVGYTTRSRVVAFLPQSNTFDFGGPSSSNDGDAPAYFVSDYPDIESVFPSGKTPFVQPGTINYTYTLTLSKPLDQADQTLLEQAVRVWPADADAAPEASPAPTLQNGLDMLFANLPLNGETNSSGNYAIDSNASFGNSGNSAIVSWKDALNMNLAFGAPLQASAAGPVQYQIGLVAGATPIMDGAGHALGTDKTGAIGSAPAANGPIYYAFKSPSLQFDSSKTGDGSSAWAQTHENVAPFEIATDTAALSLTAVTSVNVGTQSQLRLSFNTPMATYDGNAATHDEHLTSSATNPANYIFAFGAAAGDVAGISLSGSPQNASALAQVATDTPMVFAPGAVTIDIDPRNPNIIRLTAAAGNDTLPSGLHAIKVRVVNVQDPSGHPIGGTNEQTGAI